MLYYICPTCEKKYTVTKRKECFDAVRYSMGYQPQFEYEHGYTFSDPEMDCFRCQIIMQKELERVTKNATKEAREKIRRGEL